MVSDEAIEAAARAIYNWEFGRGACEFPAWEHESNREALRERFRRRARAALTAALPHLQEATEQMLVAGARSIGNTVGETNHIERASACWRAMNSARDGIEEPRPTNPAAPQALVADKSEVK